jgi:tetrahydromethanopterin S-methyltransferase subunit E
MLLPIVSLLISGSVNRTVARTKRNGIFIAVVAVLFLTAYVFALVATAVWLATIYGPIGAALFMAAGALLLGIIVLVIMAIINAQEERRARERKAALESMAAVALGFVRTQPLLTAAVAAAFLLSNVMGSKKSDD